MSKKMGSKLADSLRQMRAQPPAATAASETRAVSTPAAAAVSPAAAVTRPPVDAPAPTPAASHGILHPARIWPD